MNFSIFVVWALIYDGVERKYWVLLLWGVNEKEILCVVVGGKWEKERGSEKESRKGKRKEKEQETEENKEERKVEAR